MWQTMSPLVVRIVSANLHVRTVLSPTTLDRSSASAPLANVAGTPIELTIQSKSLVPPQRQVDSKQLRLPPQQLRRRQQPQRQQPLRQQLPPLLPNVKLKVIIIMDYNGWKIAFELIDTFSL